MSVLPIRINKFTRTGIIPLTIGNGNNGANKGKKYTGGFKMSDLRRRQVRNIISFIAAEHGKPMAMLTITTCQAENNWTDIETGKAFVQLMEKWTDLFDHYVYVVERQKNGSLHFHIIVKWNRKRYARKNFKLKPTSYKNDTKKVGVGLLYDMIKDVNEFFPKTGTNGFNYRYIDGIKGIRYYLTKYVLKGNETYGIRPTGIKRKTLASYEELKANYEETKLMLIEDIEHLPKISHNEFSVTVDARTLTSELFFKFNEEYAE